VEAKDILILPMKSGHLVLPNS